MAKNPYENKWGIFNSDDLKPAFDIDCVIEVGYALKTKVSQFPIETGSFTSYNKVREAFTAKLRLSVGGDSTRINAFLSELDSAVKGIKLYNLLTPEATYKNVSLTDYAYKRSSSNGCNLIDADVSVLEIREVSPQYTRVKPLAAGTTKKASSADKKETGKQQARSVEDSEKKYSANPIVQAFRDTHHSEAEIPSWLK